MEKLKNVYNIALYTVVRNFRDYKTLSLMLMLPIVLILILGSALGSNFTPDTIGKIPVAYVNDDSGYAARAFEAFLSNSKVKELLKVKKADNLEAGLGLVKNSEAVALIYVEKGFTKALEDGSKAKLQVYSDQYNSFKVSIVKNIIGSFTENANAAVVAAKLGVPDTGYKARENVVEMPVAANGKTPRAMDYYAVTMLVMTLMYGTLYGNYAMGGDIVRKTYIRLKAAPLMPVEIIMGNVLGTIVTIVFQAAILITFTRYIYKVNWGANIPLILLICFSTVVLAVSIGIAAFSVFKSSRKASIFLSIFVSVMTFIGGGYFPINILNPQFLKLSILSPNYLAQKAMFNTIFTGSSAETYTFIWIMWALTLASIILSIIFTRRAEN